MPPTVTLRQVIDSDLPVFFEHQSDPVAFEMAAFPSRSLDAFMEHWKRIRSDKQIRIRTIVYDRRVAGTIMTFMLDGRRQVGYWIGRDLWGRGIASHALKQFLKDIQNRPLYAHVARHNVASLRVLEKSGFKIIGEVPSRVLVHGEPAQDFVLILEAG